MEIAMVHGIELVRGDSKKGPRKAWGSGLTHKVLVVLFSVVILAPNLWAIVEPYEDWPYTSLPMYAHYVDRDTPRYKFVFVGELEGGREEELSTYGIGVDYAAMRFFFMYVYGSVESSASPFNRFPGDTREAFEDRLSRFFAVYARRYESRFADRGLRGIRLRVARLRWEDNAMDELHEIGRHDVASRRFTHTWTMER